MLPTGRARYQHDGQLHRRSCCRWGRGKICFQTTAEFLSDQSGYRWHIQMESPSIAPQARIEGKITIVEIYSAAASRIVVPFAARFRQRRSQHQQRQGVTGQDRLNGRPLVPISTWQTTLRKAFLLDISRGGCTGKPISAHCVAHANMRMSVLSLDRAWTELGMSLDRVWTNPVVVSDSAWNRPSVNFIAASLRHERRSLCSRACVRGAQ